jgi:hypothetical protein
VLSPKVGDQAGERLRRDSAAKMERTERLVAQLQGKNLSRDQQDVFRSIRTFLSQAKVAIAEKDDLKAASLIEKAAVLAEELSQQVP